MNYVGGSVVLCSLITVVLTIDV